MFSDFSVGAENDDGVGALDCGQPMGDGDCGAAALHEACEGFVDEGFGFSVEGGGCCGVIIISDIARYLESCRIEK